MSTSPTKTESDGDLFESAVQALYSEHVATTKEAIQASAKRRERTISDMRIYLERIGMPVTSLHFPRLVHITGTKGKGSTACMCEAILRKRYKLKTGLFSSPHLCDIRERIRIDGKPVSQEIFGRVYWFIRRRLEECRGDDLLESPSDLPILPGYFRTLTLMALVAFARYDPTIDVVILEVGMGGRYDATNLMDTDTATHVVEGVTLIDFDHTRILGSTLEQIAWEKGGVFKVHKHADAEISPRPSEGNKNASAECHESTVKDPVAESRERRVFFVLDSNRDSVVSILRQCAKVEGKAGTVRLVPSGSPYLPSDCRIGLAGDHQRGNAELAIAMCQHLMAMGNACADAGLEATCDALSDLSWPGRCQAVNFEADPSTFVTLYLDGAHTVQSTTAGMAWFKNETEKNTGSTRVLVFNCSHERSPVELLEVLVKGEFQSVFFARADTERPSAVVKMTPKVLLRGAGRDAPDDFDDQSTSWQHTLLVLWKYLETESDILPASAVSDVDMPEVLRRVQEPTIEGNGHVQVFVTGSLYLVGSALSAVGWKEDQAKGAVNLPLY